MDSFAGGAPQNRWFKCGHSAESDAVEAGAADASIVVTALGGDGFSAVTGVARHASKDLRRAATEAVTTCLPGLDDKPNSVVMLLTDGLGGDQMEVIRGAYEVVGARVPLVGGCAGDDLKMQAPFQLFDDEGLSDVSFDCIARRGVLGDGIGSEIERIATFAGTAPVAGFYTYGEIARTTGRQGFHNQTLVVLALG